MASAWRRLPDIPMRPRHGMGVRALEGDVFAFGGYTHGREHRELFAVSADGGAWDRRRDAPFPLGRGTAVVLRGRLHTWAFHQAFSQDRGSSCAGAAYDPTSDVWEPVAPLPTGARGSALLAASDDGALLWGGYTRQHRLAGDGFVYSATDDTWTPVATGPLPPLGYGAAIWAGTEVIFWSWQDGSHQAAYEPGSKTWRLLAEPPIRPDGNMAAAWSGTECIFLGGSGKAPGHNGRRDVVAYNPTTDSWRELPKPPERVHAPRVLCHDGQLIVVGYRAVHALALDTGAGWETLEHPPLPPGQNDASLVGSELWMPGFVPRAEPWVDQTSPMMAVDLARSADHDGRVASIGAAAAPSRLQVAPGLADYIASSGGAVHLCLLASTVNGLEGMRRARAAIFDVPHPEEPSDPLPSFASSVELVDGAPAFWFDAADAEAYDDLADQVIAVIVAALESSGADGLLTWPGGPTA